VWLLGLPIQVRVQVVDVTEATKLHAFFDAVDAAAPVDLVIANAGISGMMESSDETYTVLQSAINVTQTNVLGVVHTIFPAIAKMCQRRRGQVVLMGSLSGNFPLQGAPEYGASKAYLSSISRALRKYLATYHVGLTLLEPGFVRTPMLTSSKRYPFEIPLAAALPTMLDYIARDVGFASFPAAPAILTQLLGSVHPIFFDVVGPLVFTRLHRKVSARLTLTEAAAAAKRK
jgi:short-subunit dehydrogenase